MAGRGKAAMGFRIAVALLVVGVGAWLLTARPPALLLEHAATFCTVPAWRNPRNLNAGRSFAWVSDREVILEGDLSLDPVPYYRVAQGATALSGRPVMSSREIGVRFSPDCRCWLAVRSSKPLTEVVVEALNPQPLHTPRAPLSTTPVWVRDSRHIAYVDRDPALCLHVWDVTTGEDRRYAMPRELENAPANQVIGFARNGNVLIAPEGETVETPTFGPPNTGQAETPVNFPAITLCELSLEPQMRIVKRRRIAVPVKDCYGMMILSPAGDRLLLVFAVDHQPTPFESWIHRILPFASDPHTMNERMMVCGLDGDHLHDLGIYRQEPSQPDVIAPTWTPDGKRIGFVYGDRIMTVPAD